MIPLTDTVREMSSSAPLRLGRTGLIVALDMNSQRKAEEMAHLLSPVVDMFKTGMEYNYSGGLSANTMIEKCRPLFLDLKLYDIPATVKKGVKSLMRYRPRMITIHASGGEEMIKYAKEGLLEGALEHQISPPALLAVTVLTSFSPTSLEKTGIKRSPLEQAVLLGKLAVDSGADGLVCSGHELAPLRQAIGKNPLLVTPGIRPAGHDANDQKRTMTPAEAAKAGADWIVVGRPITQSSDPQHAARLIFEELSNIAKIA